VGHVVTNNSDELLSVTGASIYLKLAADTVRRYADEGRLPCVRNSVNARQFRRRDLERYRRKHLSDNDRHRPAAACSR
jgi:DNA-binding transcriptional MerR regulator